MYELSQRHTFTKATLWRSFGRGAGIRPVLPTHSSFGGVTDICCAVLERSYAAPGVHGQTSVLQRRRVTNHGVCECQRPIFAQSLFLRQQQLFPLPLLAAVLSHALIPLTVRVGHLLDRHQFHLEGSTHDPDVLTTLTVKCSTVGATVQ